MLIVFENSGYWEKLLCENCLLCELVIYCYRESIVQSSEFLTFRPSKKNDRWLENSGREMEDENVMIH